MTIYTLLAIICLAGSVLLAFLKIGLVQEESRVHTDALFKRIGRLEAANLELLKERAELDAKFLEWTKAIHKDIDELREIV